ncbi:MAG: 50S ribosomal protein L18 [Candidatus Bathyarchaeia archaeon]
MGHGSRYRLAFRRRRQGRTDYRMRKRMVLSGHLRLVVRPSIRNLMAQLIEARPEGDRVLVACNSNDLKAYGWQGPTGNVPAAYLTGYLIGKKAMNSGVESAILDIGIRKATVGSRIFAAVKGAIDTGLSVPCSEDVLPSDERIVGGHIAAYAKQLAETDQSLYRRIFSRYLVMELKPEELSKHVEKVKEKINMTFGGNN